MDESPFNLAFERKKRKVGPRGHPRNGQAIPASGEHITVLATIGTLSVPVPPVIIYSGATIQQTWTTNHDPSIPHKADVTESGWVNNTVALRWLRDAFDPYTRNLVPPGKRRLLFMDGHNSHINVDFLEACWALDIVVIIFPASLSARFQPLDVNFFDFIKKSYHDKLDYCLLGSGNAGVAKGMFWSWHQQAWKAGTRTYQLEAA